MKLCIFWEFETENRLGHKRMEPPNVGDYVIGIPGQGTTEWFVRRRRIEIEREEVQVWVDLVI